jgi:peptidoglycan/xylan/chitin deacetylase (PgdA/CDA1 family)
MSSLVISLDFELFWGVTDSHSIASYGRHVEGEWKVVPRLLELFCKYGIKATWATVGMAMCRDYTHWREIRPSVLPGYCDRIRSAYSMDDAARAYPQLFFARPLVEQILDTPGQELGTHTYSHFYCAEPEVTEEQFAADLRCAQSIAAELGIRHRSFVFPRNQVVKKFLPFLVDAGIDVYRGNPDHWLYRHGNAVAGGIAGRAVRLADSWLPISGTRTVQPESVGAIVNVPASLFLRPWSHMLAAAEPIRMARLKKSMTTAARTGAICHLWWHPHNFGVNTEQNLAILESLLQHYRSLQDQYGMCSSQMREFYPKDPTATVSLAVS